MIRCSECRTRNPDNSNFCSACGHPLRRQRRSHGIWLWLAAAAAFGAGIALVVVRQLPPVQSDKILISAPRPTISDHLEIPTRSVPEPRRPTREAVGVALARGRVALESISGETLAEFPTTLVAGGWTALPRRICVGAYRWLLRSPNLTQVDIVGGILGEQDEVGLWRIQDDQWLQSPQLSSWRIGESLIWQSIVSGAHLPVTDVTVVSEQQYLTRIAVAQAIREPGVYVQAGAVVGWTFGDLLPGAGFLWRGLEGQDLSYRMRVDDFYRLTFADGREEAFMQALSMGADYSDAQRLKALAEAFYREPRLSREQTPAHLSREGITNHMRVLIASIREQGSLGEVVDSFDAWILIAAGDAALVSDVIQATVASQGHEDALSLLDEVFDGIELPSNAEEARLSALQSTLYVDWITHLLEQGDLEGAWRAFYHGERLMPDDPAVLLSGVQVALAEGNWREAARLLESIGFPQHLKPRVEALQARLAELRTRENQIVIRFTPNSRHIPVIATLNRAVRQRFIIDTGASLTTIPRSIADQLGLMAGGDHPTRRVYTAGGVREALEVRLSVIALHGYEVSNLRALVLDIPEQPDLGLLGLDFLKHFRMDLNSEAGMLLLEPR